MEFTLKQLESAKQLAYKYHDGQYRDGNQQIPYIEHPKKVVDLLKRFGYENDYYIQALGWMHDVLEDCSNVNIEQLISLFGENFVYDLNILTYKPQDRLYDKAIYMLNICEYSETDLRLFILKCADRFCNVVDFHESDDPKKKQYAYKYFNKAEILWIYLFKRNDVKLDSVKKMYHIVKKIISKY